MQCHPLLAPAGPSLAGRFAAAIALTIGFYLLALVLVAGLLALAILPWSTRRRNIWLTITALFLGGSILSRSSRAGCGSQTPGPKITEADEPRLIELIADEAKAAGEPVPDDVYLTLEANAAVTQASRTRRVLIVGVPLLHILTERELRGRDRARVRPLHRRRHAARPVDLPHARDDRAHDRPAQR